MQNIQQLFAETKPNAFGIGHGNKITDPVVLAPLRQAKAEETAGYTYAGRIEISALEWASISDNPRQRDTAAHAKKAKHLKVYDPIHRFVQMARLPDGRTFKLDGHTRSYVWSRGEVGGPASVYVDVFDCATEEAVKALYSKLDSQAAVETGADKITGAAREHKLEFVSPMLRAGRYGSAVKRLYMYSTKTWSQWTQAQFIHDAVGFFKEELLLLDSLKPQPRNFPTGVMMSAMATFRRRGKLVMPFWEEYAAGRGNKVGDRMDAVQALHEAVMAAKNKKSTHGMGQQLGLLDKGILAAEAYRRSYEYKVGRGLGNMSEESLRDYLRHSTEA